MQAGSALTLHGRERFGSAQEEDERLNELMDRAKSIAFFDRAVGLSDRPLVRAVSLDHRTASEPTIRAAIEAMAHLPEIERVTLWGTFFDDATCEALARLPNLQELSLRSTNVSGRGLAKLESLPELRTLTLSDPTASRALAGIHRLRRLRKLTLFNLYISGDAIAGIATLPELASLELIGAPSKDEATFRSLGVATNLRSLSIIGSGFGDDDLPALAGLRELESLDVRVDEDAGLLHLSNLPKLRRLELSGSVTRDAVRRFSASHPEVAIRYRSPDGTGYVRFLNGVSDEDDPPNADEREPAAEE